MIVHTEVVPDCITDAPTEAFPDTVTPAPIVTAVIQHTRNLHHIEAHQPIPEIAAGPEQACHINPVRTLHLNLHPDQVG